MRRRQGAGRAARLLREEVEGFPLLCGGRSRPELRGPLLEGVREGLGALRRRDRAHFQGLPPCASLDLDGALEEACPREARFDYALYLPECSKKPLRFAEVHPARSGEDVEKMRKKLAWLEDFVGRERVKGAVHWISTGTVKITTRKHKRRKGPFRPNPQSRGLYELKYKYELRGPTRRFLC